MSALTCPPCRSCGMPSSNGWPLVVWRKVFGAWDWICRGCQAWAEERREAA